MMFDLFVSSACGVMVYALLMGMHYAFAHEDRRRLRARFFEPVARFLKRILRSRWLCRYGVTCHDNLLLDSMRIRRSSAEKYRDALAARVIDAATSIYVTGAGDLVEVSADRMTDYTDRFYRVVRLREMRKLDRFYKSELMEA